MADSLSGSGLRSRGSGSASSSGGGGFSSSIGVGASSLVSSSSIVSRTRAVSSSRLPVSNSPVTPNSSSTSSKPPAASRGRSPGPEATPLSSRTSSTSSVVALPTTVSPRLLQPTKATEAKKLDRPTNRQPLKAGSRSSLAPLSTSRGTADDAPFSPPDDHRDNGVESRNDASNEVATLKARVVELEEQVRISGIFPFGDLDKVSYVREISVDRTESYLRGQLRLSWQHLLFRTTVMP